MGLSASLYYIMVPRVGVEPTRGRPRQILSLVRLPVPPPRHCLESSKWINRSQWFMKPAFFKVRKFFVYIPIIL